MGERKPITKERLAEIEAEAARLQREKDYSENMLQWYELTQQAWPYMLECLGDIPDMAEEIRGCWQEIERLQALARVEMGDLSGAKAAQDCGMTLLEWRTFTQQVELGLRTRGK